MKKLIAFFLEEKRPLGFLLLGVALFYFLLSNDTGKEGIVPYVVLFVAWGPIAIIIICNLVFSYSAKRKNTVKIENTE